jgi:molybdenum cofactor biosynthesis enzyme MoaA
MSTFCSLPWIHLASHPHGGVTLCCVSDHANAKNRARNFNVDKPPTYLDLNKDSVETIMNSDYYRVVRLQMLNDVKPEACLRCYREEDNNVRSKRIEENEKFGFTEDMARALTSKDGAIPVNLKFIELRLGNLCNIKCRTCNPASSTKWSQEYQKLQKEIKFVTNYEATIDASWTENDAFWDDLLAHSNDVEMIYINGGEPTLVEKHWHYLERLIQAGLNKQVTLWYNINMTNLPDKLLAIWEQFKKVQVSCSIDDLGRRNEYIRSGTSWLMVLNNLNKLQSIKSINTSICQTVGWMNIFYLPEFMKFMQDRGLHVHMNFVHDPNFLSAAHLPQNVKDLIIARCQSLDKWQLNAVQSYLSQPADEVTMRQGFAYNQWLDNRRKTSYSEIFPEMAPLINYV